MLESQSSQPLNRQQLQKKWETAFATLTSKANQDNRSEVSEVIAQLLEELKNRMAPLYDSTTDTQQLVNLNTGLDALRQRIETVLK